jgi:putative methyltransferase (TIGR04325 family)
MRVFAISIASIFRMLQTNDTSSRGRAITVSSFKVWDGVYASFDQAPAAGPGFDGPTWRERSLKSARDTAAKLAAGETLDYSLRQRNALLPIVAATLLSWKSRVSILDFGGSLGTAFIILSHAIGKDIGRVDYRVVEVDGICCVGRELFAEAPRPTFQSALPSAETFDIVQASSTLQYVEDWRNAIGRLSAYRAPFLVLGDLLIGDFTSYVTLQNYYDSRIRSWFINADDFIGEVKRHGYQLALRSECDSRILGSDGPLPMDNFPPHLRIERTVHLLFAKAPQS